jgi:hypothetical protein
MCVYFDIDKSHLYGCQYTANVPHMENEQLSILNPALPECYFAVLGIFQLYQGEEPVCIQ